ncbi:MAG: hypothetical protein R3C39_14070 [Dehalococcoidia bacterium]
MSPFRGVVATALLATLLLACSRDEERPTATPTPPPTATTDAAVAPTEISTPTTEVPKPTPVLENLTTADPTLTEGVLLIDATTGAVTHLYEGATWRSLPFWDETGTSVWLNLYRFDPDATIWQHFDLDGRIIEEQEGRPTLRPSLECADLPTRDEIELPPPAEQPQIWGVSPDCTTMLIEADLASPDAPGTPRGHWLFDVATGNLTLLTDQARTCGGCDGIFGAAWSPSGRYLLHAESYSAPDGGRVWLSDTTTGDTRLLTDTATAGSATNAAGNAPAWLPAETVDAVLYPAPATEGGSMIETLAANEVRRLPDLEWPAHFEASGRYVYAVSEDRTSTVIAEVDTGTTVAEWPGVPATRWWEGFGSEPETIIATPEGPAAILTPSDRDTVGLTIHHSPLPGGELTLPNAARGATWSPDGTRIALATRGDTSPEATWTIGLLDTTTGARTELVTLPLYQDFPPKLTWNEAGTHLLVLWPSPVGL